MTTSLAERAVPFCKRRSASAIGTSSREWWRRFREALPRGAGELNEGAALRMARDFPTAPETDPERDHFLAPGLSRSAMSIVNGPGGALDHAGDDGTLSRPKLKSGRSRMMSENRFAPNATGGATSAVPLPRNRQPPIPDTIIGSYPFQGRGQKAEHHLVGSARAMPEKKL